MIRQRKPGPRFDIKLVIPPKKQRRLLGRWIRQGRLQPLRTAARFLDTERSVEHLRANRRTPQRYRRGDHWRKQRALLQVIDALPSAVRKAADSLIRLDETTSASAHIRQ